METKEVMEAIASTDAIGGADYVLRKCSFNPKEHLINLENDPNKTPRLYLTVEWRVYWMQVWCQENGKKFAIKERPVELLPGTNYIQTSCSVLIEGEESSEGIGGINLAGAKGGDYSIQSCATIAKGRALANAGFGSVFSSALDSENGADVPCDGGMGTNFFVFKPQFLGPNAGNPLSGQAPAPAPAQPAPAPAPAPVQQPAAQQPNMTPQPFAPAFTEQPARKATEVPATGNAPKTREEALNFIVTMKGTWYGHPLSEVMAKSPKDVKWYSTCRDADLKAAALLVLSKE